METNEITNTEDLNRSDEEKYVKNPKKVAAGKKLKKEKELNSNSSQVDISTIYNGIQSIAGLVGTGFTLYHGWKFF